ncbi:putative glycolipid-binding domain-containing protein [Chloroflexi bacterium TSY]|nr:putative glycolipid-binding domain-containing protein [Chloroflexi bacterium TSY]
MNNCKRVVRWSANNGLGLEHLSFNCNDQGAFIESVIIGNEDRDLFAATYELRCDSNWNVITCIVQVIGGHSMTLSSNGKGRWTDGDGKHLKELEGCIDVDISVTPFTNTLPIRRLGLCAGERKEVVAAYIPVPTLTPRPFRQAYTCLEVGSKYFYEGLSSGFEVDLAVDNDQIVIDYLDIFKRVN